MKTLILLLCLILCLLFTFFLNDIKERFLSKFVENKLRPLQIVHEEHDTLEKDTSLIITDVFSYPRSSHKNAKLFSALPDKLHVLFITILPQNKPFLKDFHGTIAYIDHKPLLELILRAHNKSNTIRKIEKTADVTPSECLFILSTNASYDGTFIDYIPGLNKQEILRQIPTIKTKDIASENFLGNKKDTNNIFQMVYTLDMILIGYSDLEKNDNLNTELNNLLQKLDMFDATNLYAFYYDIFKQTKQYIQFKNIETNQSSGFSP